MNRGIHIIVASAMASTTILPVAAAVEPEPDDVYVRDVVSRAAGHVEAGRYDEALAVLDEAERTRPYSVFIYVRATIEERRGDCERAAALYREFLEHEVPDADARDARDGEARCREALGLPASDAPPDAPTPTTDETFEEPPPPWHTDPLGGVLVVAGVAGVGVGAGLYVQSRVDERAASTATSLQLYDDRSRRAVRLNAAGIATLAIGSALLAGGIVRYALIATRGRRRIALTPTWTRGGLAVTTTVRF